MKEFLFGFAAFACGVLVSYVNYLIGRRSLSGGKMLYSAPLRSVVSAAFLIALFFIGDKTEAPTVPLLLGGALGLTAGLILFTYLLMKKFGGGKGE